MTGHNHNLGQTGRESELLSPYKVTSTAGDAHDEARRRFAEYAIHNSSFADTMADLYTACQVQNERHFGDKLKQPHLTFGRTAPRSLALCKVLTDWGGRLQITLNENLMWGRSRVIRRAWPAEGTRRFVHDLLLHEQAHQLLFEIIGVDEKGYRGHGPRFAETCNRIGGELGLPAVAVRRRGDKDKERPVCNQWPVCVRQPEYYLGHVVLPGWEQRLLEQGLLSEDEVEAAEETTRPSIRSLAGVMELCQFFLESNQAEKLRAILERETGNAHPPAKPAANAFEDGRQDASGRPLPAIDIRPDWLMWNGGCVGKMAEAIWQKHAFDNLPLLADGLEAAGCAETGLLDHCRAWVRHTRRCWVVKRLLNVATR
jgi:hypothetical protein